MPLCAVNHVLWNRSHRLCSRYNMAEGWTDSRTSAEIHAEKRVTFGAVQVPLRGTRLASCARISLSLPLRPRAHPMRHLLTAATAALLTLAAAPAQSQTIGTTEPYNFIGPFGSVPTIGQTVTAVNSSLDSFSFWLRGDAPERQYRAYVFAWDNTSFRATGDALFTSAIANAPGGGTGSYHQVTFNTGGVTVSSGNPYVLFLSTSGLAGSGNTYFGLSNPGTYEGGGTFYLNSNAWTTQAWNSQYSYTDLHFEATFSGAPSVVPEPVTMVLLGTGLAGVGALRRRRRSALLNEA
jgi:hypothetical protein